MKRNQAKNPPLYAQRLQLFPTWMPWLWYSPTWFLGLQLFNPWTQRLQRVISYSKRNQNVDYFSQIQTIKKSFFCYFSTKSCKDAKKVKKFCNLYVWADSQIITCIHWVFSDALNFWNCNSLKTQLMTENSVLLEMINAWEGGAADGGELSCWTMFLLAAITWSCFYCVVGHLNRVRNDYDFATIENRNPRIIEKKLKVLIKSIPAHEIKGPVLKCMRRR